MITREEFLLLVDRLGQQGEDDIQWAEEECVLPACADLFAREVVFVICNSGMRYTVARGIFERVMAALQAGTPVLDVFKHAGKVGAIEHVWRNREELYAELLHRARSKQQPDELLAFCGSLPWIGDITKYHLAKHFGADVAKPDVHLQRLADREGCTSQELCERLAKATGWRIATVDTLLWRACATGLLDSRTGVIQGHKA